MSDTLPIDEALPTLVAALGATRQAVLQAPPGAGKTTRVPLALLKAGPVQGRIILLEPRRLAARNAAHRMAETLGEEVGGTVGYTVRLERRVSARTRIEVVTEGILTRRLQQDPELSGTGLVIVNPPYGTRIGDRKPLFGLYGALGQVLTSRFSGWRVGLITTDASLAQTTGLPFAPSGPPVLHGGLKVTLFRAGPLP